MKNLNILIIHSWYVTTEWVMAALSVFFTPMVAINNENDDGGYN